MVKIMVQVFLDNNTNVLLFRTLVCVMEETNAMQTWRKSLKMKILFPEIDILTHSCTVTLYSNGSYFMPRHPDNESSIKPDSFYVTIMMYHFSGHSFVLWKRRDECHANLEKEFAKYGYGKFYKCPKVRRNFTRRPITVGDSMTVLHSWINAVNCVVEQMAQLAREVMF